MKRAFAWPLTPAPSGLPDLSPPAPSQPGLFSPSPLYALPIPLYQRAQSQLVPRLKKCCTSSLPCSACQLWGVQANYKAAPMHVNDVYYSSDTNDRLQKTPCPMTSPCPRLPPDRHGLTAVALRQARLPSNLPHPGQSPRPQCQRQCPVPHLGACLGMQVRVPGPEKEEPDGSILWG